MERGLLRRGVIADELAPYNTHADTSDVSGEMGRACPTHQPSTVVPIIAAATRHLGVGVTLSIRIRASVSMCRRLSSLDHLSNGRIAWNIVSSYSKSEWDAYGHTMTERAAATSGSRSTWRLLQAWESWEPGAIVADKASGIYADPARSTCPPRRQILQCHGRHFCAPSPQAGRCYAGGIVRSWTRLRAKHAEAIFAVHPNVDRMKQYADDLNERLGRSSIVTPGSVKLISADVVAETRFGGAGKVRAHQGMHPSRRRARPIPPLRPRLLEIFTRTTSCRTSRYLEIRACSSRTSTRAGRR